MSIRISAIICTLNRVACLEKAIQSLVDQTLPKEQYEIIIVDNGSTDNTRNVVDDFILKARACNIKYVFEPKQGLSNARNAGFRESSAEYVAYIDNDARADKNWLLEASRIIGSMEADIVGGPIYPFYEEEKLKWFLDKYEIRTHGNKPRFLGEKEYISGSNIIIKSDILKLLSGFDPKIGMQGNKLSYGEETKLIEQARKRIKNFKLYYSPKMLVYHLVASKKMNLKYFIKSEFTSGMCAPHVWKSEITKTKFETFKLSIMFIKRTLYILLAISRMLFRDKAKYEYLNNYVVEVICPQFYNLGRIYEQLLTLIKKSED